MSPIQMFRNFLKLEASAGILLAFSAFLAILIVNFGFDELYQDFLSIPVVIAVGSLIIDKPLLLWINDGLMAIFFLLVGLEIKREILEGQLSTKDQVILPLIAALGGLMMPALIYAFINWHDKEALHGWAIPAATDIAFALGVITLLGRKVPESLKICLVAIAIIDDLAAIIIIALFYTSKLSLIALFFAALSVISLAILNRKNVTAIAPYMIIGFILWVCVLKSGVHATLAGVIVAMFIPLKIKDSDDHSPARKLERGLHNWVAYSILPIFAFANAGVSLHGFSLSMLTNNITLGIILGLFFGKQLGVMMMTSIICALRICKLPNNVNWLQYYGMALITGIGFTMSLFIGSLTFDNSDQQSSVRIGVIVGSLLSGLFGYLILLYAHNRQKAK